VNGKMKQKLDQFSLISISGESYRVIGGPDSHRYQLDAMIKVNKDVNTLSNYFVEILKYVPDEVELGQIDLRPVLQVNSCSIVPMIELACENKMVSRKSHDLVYEIVISFLSKITTIIHPENCSLGELDCSDNHINELVDNKSHDFRSVFGGQKLKNIINVYVGDNACIDIGGKWEMNSQCKVKTNQKLVHGRIDLLGRQRSKIFTIFDDSGKVFKINYRNDEEFSMLHERHGTDDEYVFSVREDIYSTTGKSSMELIEIIKKP
jgi:hypothetical protein